MAGYFYPGQCVAAGFRNRLLLRAISPIMLLFAIPLCTIAFFYCRHARNPRTRGRWLSDAAASAAPFDLFVSFLLCPTVSKGIFDTWDCTKYELDTGDVRTFLNADLQIVCSGNDHPEEYDKIKTIANFFLVIWPIGMPLIYMLVLFPSRQALRQGRRTRMVQATAFLHKEYNPTFFWWEIVTLTQRLVLTGWVLLIPIENDAWRIFLGLLTTIGYLSLLQFVQPYKRKSFNTLAIAVQFSLVCVFLGGAFIKLFSGDGVDSATCDGAAASDTNDDSVYTIVCIMAAFNFFVLTLYAMLAAHQFSTSSVLPSVRLVATGQVPDLKLEASHHRYHLFLSHVWSSGQDQMATVKRELQLLLHGVRVFLDVDDLEEIGQLENYVHQSQSMLFFLSKGYFFSANCKKEIAATLANGNPTMLLHETDPNRGGAPMDQLLADCPDDWRKEIFCPDDWRRPVIPWLRVKEFKIVTLKMIVSSMLLHQSKMERKLQARSYEDIQAEAGLSRTGKHASASSRRSSRGRLRLNLAPSRRRSSTGASIHDIGVVCEPTMSVRTESCADTAAAAPSPAAPSAEGGVPTHATLPATHQAAERRACVATSAEASLAWRVEAVAAEAAAAARLARISSSQGSHSGGSQAPNVEGGDEEVGGVSDRARHSGGGAGADNDALHAVPYSRCEWLPTAPEGYRGEERQEEGATTPPSATIAPAVSAQGVQLAGTLYKRSPTTGMYKKVEAVIEGATLCCGTSVALPSALPSVMLSVSNVERLRVDNRARLEFSLLSKKSGPERGRAYAFRAITCANLYSRSYGKDCD